MAKIYTRKGDDGNTRLFDGTKVPKDDPVLEAYGTIDELSSFLGMCRSLFYFLPEDSFNDEKLYNIGKTLEWAQNKLGDISYIMSSLANEGKANKSSITDNEINYLENQIDGLSDWLPQLKSLILYSGHPVSTSLQTARAVARRAERRAVTLHRQKNFDTNILKFLNRLSDYLFEAGRGINYSVGIEEKNWVMNKE